MSSIGLCIYTLNIYDSSAKHCNLESLYEGKDIFQILKDFMNIRSEKFTKFSQLETVSKSEDWEIISQYDSYEYIEAEDHELMRFFYGRIKTGEYGVESEIIDVDTSETTHQVMSHEARVMPFDFLIAMYMDTKDQALILLQTQGKYGIKSQLELQLSNYISSLDSSYVLKFGKVVPKTYIRNYLENGIIKKLKLYNYNIPNDKVDSYGIIPTDKRKCECRIISSPEGFTQRIIHNITECLNGNRMYCDIVELDDFEIDDLKVEFAVRGKKKTISLKNIDSVVVSIDISDDVDTKGGNPLKESIKSIFIDYAEEYAKLSWNYQPIETRCLQIRDACKERK